MIGALIGGALALGSSIYGGYKASQAAKEAKGIVDRQMLENQNWYDRRYNEDATQRADAQRLLSITADNIRQRNKAAAGAQAVMGGTEASVAAAKAANNQALADAVGRIAVAGEARKDDIESRYLGTKAGLNRQLTDIENNRARAIAEATKGAASAAGSLGGAIDAEQEKANILNMLMGS